MGSVGWQVRARTKSSFILYFSLFLPCFPTPFSLALTIFLCFRFVVSWRLVFDDLPAAQVLDFGSLGFLVLYIESPPSFRFTLSRRSMIIVHLIHCLVHRPTSFISFVSAQPIFALLHFACFSSSLWIFRTSYTLIYFVLVSPLPVCSQFC